MNTNDALRRAQDPKVPEPPRQPGAHVDINISSTEKAKTTVSTGSGRPRPSGWPKDGEEWKRLVRAALPWIAGAAIVVAATASVKKNRDEDGDLSYGELTSRKARRAARKGEAALEDAKDKTERTWFGFKRRANETADDAADKLGSAKDIAARKAREARDAAKGTAKDAQGFVKDRAHDAKEGVKEAGWWASDKAHDVADAAKGAAHKVEEKVAGVGSAALATASAAEEKTGSALKNAGGKLEKDGRESKRFYRGEEVKAETKAKTGCSIM